MARLSASDDFDLDILPDAPIKGRGAISNRSGRFEAETRVRVADGWEGERADPEAGEGSVKRPATEVRLDTTRSIIARNRSPDIPFDQSINPYRGCEHGCIYCYARPTHAFLGLSPGLDFETKLYAKPEAARLLEGELGRPGYKPSPIALGTNTDPYQPIERRFAITRSILEVLSNWGHPASIVTKSANVTRDIDILAPMAARGLVSVAMSVTTLDSALARVLEPRASTPSLRLAAIGELARAGVPVGVMVAPVIPGLTDREIERVLEAAALAGAGFAGHVLLRLPLEIKDLFAEWLEANVPLKARHVLALIRDTRDGKLNDARFGARMKGSGPYAELIHKRFRLACRRLGLDKRDWRLTTGLFKPPPRPGDQLSLL